MCLVLTNVVIFCVIFTVAAVRSSNKLSIRLSRSFRFSGCLKLFADLDDKFSGCDTEAEPLGNNRMLRIALISKALLVA